MTFGYLAQPIDQARNRQWINQLIAAACGLAADSQIDLYQPAKAYKLATGRELRPGTASAIDWINQRALDLAEVLFAVLPHGVATLGTPVEIERSLGRGLPVVVVTEDRLRDTSVQVRSWADAGALVVTIQAIEEDPVGAARACRALLQRARDEGPRVATEPPRDLLPYVRAHEAASVPGKAYDDDAGLDLAACEPAVIPARGSARIRTGLRFALPPGMFGLIVGRSSTWAKRGLDVKLGVIDAGWRGELFAMCYNPTDTDAKIEVGERLAQYVLLPAWSGKLVEVDELPEHPRGTNGFGSSGH